MNEGEVAKLLVCITYANGEAMHTATKVAIVFQDINPQAVKYS